MQIEYFAMLRQATGKNREQWNKPAGTLGELLRDLSERYGPGFSRWLLDGDQLSDIAIIMVNGRDVRHLQGLATPLQPDDTIAIFPPVAGGK